MADVVGGVLWAAEQVASKLADARADSYTAMGKTGHKGSVTDMSLDDTVNRAVESGAVCALPSLPAMSPDGVEKAVTAGALYLR